MKVDGGDVAGVDVAVLRLIAGEVRSLHMEHHCILEESSTGG